MNIYVIKSTYPADFICLASSKDDALLKFRMFEVMGSETDEDWEWLLQENAIEVTVHSTDGSFLDYD